MKKVLFLATTALVLIGLLVVPACNGNGNDNGNDVDPKYNLTVTVSPAGSGTTTPTGTTQHEEGAVVNVAATPGTDYVFVNWTATVGAVAAPDAASTTYTMPGQAVTLTANFEAVAPVPTIKIAIAGPMDYIQGEHMRYGAELARNEINALPNKVNVAGTPHAIELIIVDTDEIDNPAEAGEKVEHAITVRGAEFVIGGFRTEAVWDMLDAAADNQKIMFITGAATRALIGDTVVANYDKYKYIFRGTPINDVFLVNNTVHKLAMVGFTAQNVLAGQGAAVTTPRVAIFAEELTWADPIVQALQFQLIPALGWDLTEVVRVADNAPATVVDTELAKITAAQTHIIVTVLSGPVGITYGTRVGALEVPAMSVGINVEAQDPGYWNATDGGAAYHITLNTYAPNIRQSDLTGPFLDAFATHTGGKFPVYTANSYDMVYGIKLAIESAGSVTDTDAHIAFLENPANARDITTGTLGYYPAGLPSPFHQHDIMYGPDWVTGIGVQWVDGEIVGVWPKKEFGAAPGNLVDLFGDLIDWTDFEHEGTVMFQIPPWMIGAWMGYS